MIRQLLFLPYARLIPHRHPLSHLPVVGTLGRLAYVVGWCAVVWVLADRPPLPEVAAWVWPLLAAGAAGLAWVDFWHWIFDGCPI